METDSASMANHIGTWLQGKEKQVRMLRQGISQATNDEGIQNLIDLPLLKQEFSVTYVGLEDRPNLIINYPFNKKKITMPESALGTRKRGQKVTLTSRNPTSTPKPKN